MMRTVGCFFLSFYLLLMAAAAAALAWGGEAARRPLGWIGAALLLGGLLAVLAGLATAAFAMGLGPGRGRVGARAAVVAGLSCAVAVPGLYALLDLFRGHDDLGVALGTCALAWVMGAVAGARARRRGRD